MNKNILVDNVCVKLFILSIFTLLDKKMSRYEIRTVMCTNFIQY